MNEVKSSWLRVCMRFCSFILFRYPTSKGALAYWQMLWCGLLWTVGGSTVFLCIWGGLARSTQYGTTIWLIQFQNLSHVNKAHGQYQILAWTKGSAEIWLYESPAAAQSFFELPEKIVNLQFQSFIQNMKLIPHVSLVYRKIKVSLTPD